MIADILEYNVHSTYRRAKSSVEVASSVFGDYALITLTLVVCHMLYTSWYDWKLHLT